MPSAYVSHETILSQINVVDNRQANVIQAALDKLKSEQQIKAADFTKQQQQAAAPVQSKSVVSKG